MKIRIKGNSIRLRLTKTEVQRIKSGQPVREEVSFGGGVRLSYGITPVVQASEIEASFEGKDILIQVPDRVARSWAESTEISLSRRQPLEGGDALFLLIEKDLTCLKPREHGEEDESDLFTNPNEAHGHCGGATSLRP